MKKYRIGIANISSYTNDENLNTIVRNLCNTIASEVIIAPNVRRRYRFFAGTEAERAECLTDLMSENIDLIMFIRGGYGAIKTLSNFGDMVFSGKYIPLVGMSDLTAFFIYAYQKYGYNCFYGPNLVSEFQSPERTVNKANIFDKIFDSYPMGLFGNYDIKGVNIIRHGKACAKLLGGNLATITSMIGTPYIKPFEDHVLFIEDTGERPYKVDRMLYQCFSSGLFSGLQGVLIGDFSHNVNGSETMLFADVFNHYFAKKDYPVIAGLPFGHGKDKCTIPFGKTVSIDTGDLSFRLYED